LASYAVIAQISASNRSTVGYGDQQQSLVERVLFIFVYAAPLFGGTLLAVSRRAIDRTLGTISIAVCWLVLTLFGSRMGALFGGAFWVGSYLATKVATVGVADSGRLFARVIAGASVAVFGISILAMIIRYRAGGAGPSLTTMVSDPFGFVTAFAYWVRDGGIWQGEGLLWGQRTFERILGLFMSTPERPGAIDVGFTTSNIFTIYRGLVEDFGPLGTVLALVGLGAAGQLSFRKAAAGNHLAIAVLATIYASMFVSFSLSIFMYASTTAAIGLYLGYCALARLQGGSVVSPAVVRPA
jgi:oligosaccharide repeat unit polymerase